MTQRAPPVVPDIIDRNRRVIRRNRWILRVCWVAFAVNALMMCVDFYLHRNWSLLLSTSVVALVLASMVRLCDANIRLEGFTAMLERHRKSQ